MRVNFNPNRYPGERLYQDVVDQVVQNVWSAGMYPILCPQSLPDGSTLDQQVERGQGVVEAMARKYRGAPVWMEICNEPHEFGSWLAWKPVATRYVRAIRAIDPGAFVIVPFEGYGKDGRAAAKDPIRDVDVDLYDGHAYVAPADVPRLFGPAVNAGLPMLIGEYGGGADYLTHLDAALERLSPGLLAAAPWAFTVKGEDLLPLVEGSDGDGVRFTPAGRAIVEDYALWDSGRRRTPKAR
jgi:hypothetical protein